MLAWQQKRHPKCVRLQHAQMLYKCIERTVRLCQNRPCDWLHGITPCGLAHNCALAHVSPRDLPRNSHHKWPRLTSNQLEYSAWRHPLLPARSACSTPPEPPSRGSAPCKRFRNSARTRSCTQYSSIGRLAQADRVHAARARAHQMLCKAPQISSYVLSPSPSRTLWAMPIVCIAIICICP